MAGMYPDNQELNIFGEKVQWPGVDSSGKFSNGSFQNPLEKPSFIPAETINLILDNLSELITKLGGTPDNTSIDQLAKLFTVAATANTGIMRDASGRAKVAAPEADDDIARKVDVRNGDATIKASLDTHIGNRNNPHSVTKVEIGLDNVDNTSDAQKSVKYAATAGSAKANGGNADTVDGWHAGTGTGMLVPVTAFSISGGTGYIKFGNGLLLQWGTTGGTPGQSITTVYFPVAFSSNNYSIAGMSQSGDGHLITYSLTAKTSSYCTIKRWKSSDFSPAAEQVFFIAIGV